MGSTATKITTAAALEAAVAAHNLTNVQIGAMVNADLVDRKIAAEFVIGRMAARAIRKNVPAPTL